jgi:hypothetical protein
MTFADLQVGDFFLWSSADLLGRDSVNVNVKIARSEDGGGFAIDLATREDGAPPRASAGEVPSWIPGGTRVLKLNGTL